ncbi:AAA family ATPase [Azospirillum argentinense]
MMQHPHILAEIDKARPVDPATDDGELFPALSLADCLARQQRPARWLIKGWLPESGLAVLFGPSNAFKSFVALDMALHIAHGIGWHGHRIAQAPALYLALEGSDGVVRQRFPGWHRHHALMETNPPARVIEVPVVLSRLPDAEKLMRTSLAAFGRPPGVIVVDVLKRAMDGSDSDDKDVAALLESCRRVFPAALILFITHSGWGDNNRSRGHSDLWGSFDTRLKANGEAAARRVTLEVERHKDADGGGAIVFELVTVETGMADEEGQSVTTLVPVRTDDAPRPQEKPPANDNRNNLTGNNAIALEALKDALARGGQKPPSDQHDNIPTSVMVVTLDAWRERFYGRKRDPDDTVEPDEAKQEPKQDTLKKAFGRARDALQGKKLVGAWGDYCWLVKGDTN